MRQGESATQLGAAGTAAAETAGAPADYAPGLERALLRVPEEGSHAALRVEGELPAGLAGTCYLNGPGRLVRGSFRYRHWLDGDGMVCALRFDGGGGPGKVPTVAFANRFVRSAKWTAEEEAGRPLFRTFGTAFAGDRLARGIALESPVNVSVYPFAGTLLAIGEQGQPWELDPLTLATRGPFSFGGALNALSPFAAHPKIDPASGELWGFGVSYASGDARLNLYRFAAGGTLLARRRLALDAPSSIHDFCLAPRHALFYLSPYLLDMPALAREGKPPLAALRWEPERGSRLLVVERATGEVVATPAIGSRYSLHTVNAWENNGRLTADVIELDQPVYDQYQEIPELFASVGRGRPVRLTVDLASGELVERRAIEYSNAPDFPAIDQRRFGEPTDDLWLLGIAATGRSGRKFFDQLVRLDWRRPAEVDLWQAPPGAYLASEPVFVPTSGGEGEGPDGSGERSGAILCHLYDARRDESSFLLFSAFDIAAGPFATIRLETPIHLAFHAVWHPE